MQRQLLGQHLSVSTPDCFKKLKVTFENGTSIGEQFCGAVCHFEAFDGTAATSHCALTFCGGFQAAGEQQATQDAPSEPAQQAPPPPDMPSTSTVLLRMLVTFFTSLVPAQAPPVNGN